MAMEPRRFREVDPDDRRREYNRRYREAHAEENKARKIAWQQANRDKANASGLRHRVRRRAEMIEAYGGRCECCGEQEPTFLTLDHVNGGGGVERRAMGVRHNAQLVTRLKREGWPKEGYRLLCWNCQFGVLQGVCPHRA